MGRHLVGQGRLPLLLFRRRERRTAPGLQLRRTALDRPQRRALDDDAHGGQRPAAARPEHRAGRRRHVPHGVDLELARPHHRLCLLARPHPLERAAGHPRDGARARGQEQLGPRTLLRRAHQDVLHLLGHHHPRPSQGGGLYRAREGVEPPHILLHDEGFQDLL